MPRAGEGGARSPLAQRKRSRGLLWVLRQVTNPPFKSPANKRRDAGEVRNVPPSPQVPAVSVEGGLGILADPPGGAEALCTCAQGKEGQGQLGVPRKRNGSPGRRTMGSVTAAESAREPGAGRARSTRLLRAVRGARSAGPWGPERGSVCFLRRQEHRSPDRAARRSGNASSPRSEAARPSGHWPGRFFPGGSGRGGDRLFLAPPHLVVASFLGLRPLHSRSLPPSSGWLSPLSSPVGMFVIGRRPTWITQRDVI